MHGGAPQQMKMHWDWAMLDGPRGCPEVGDTLVLRARR